MTAPEVVLDAPAAAPAVAPASEPEKVAPSTPETPPPDQLLSRREAKRGLHQDRPAAQPAPAATEAAPPGGADVVPPAAAPTAAPFSASIPLPENHPLREMGVTSFRATSPQEERAMRALLNGYERRATVEQLKAQLREKETREAENDARRAATQKWTGRPEYKAAVAKYAEIKDAFGQDEADLYWRGVNDGFEKLAQAEFEQRVGQLHEQDRTENAQRWKTEAWQNASLLPVSIRGLPTFSQLFEDAVMSFNAEIELGHFPQVVDHESAHKAFNGFFGTRLTLQPEVVDLYKRSTQSVESNRTAAAAKAAEEQRQRDKIAQEAVEKYKAEVANRRNPVPPHPLANLGSGSRDLGPQGGSAAAAEPAAELSAHDVRRLARQGAREDSRRRLAGP